MQAQGSPASLHRAETVALSAKTSIISKYPAGMLESVLSIEERLGRKLEGVPTRRDEEYGFPAPGSPAQFAHLSSCDYLDIFEYTVAGSTKRNAQKGGSLQDVEIESWLSRIEQPSVLAALYHGKRTPCVFTGGFRLLYVCRLQQTLTSP
jgi:hypothetical protein